jgi:hypothetical protein
MSIYRKLYETTKMQDNIEIKGTTTFSYFRSIFTNSGKYKEEVLGRKKQARRATRILNSIFGAHILHSIQINEYFTLCWKET